MIQFILENHTHIENKIRQKIKRGEKINILISEPSSNTSKVSLISALQKVDGFHTIVHSDDQSIAAKNLYNNLNSELILGEPLHEVIESRDIDILFINHPHYYFDFTTPSHSFYKKLDKRIFTQCLICYIPYAYISISNPEVFTDYFHSFSWRFYIESFFHLREVNHYARNIERIPNQVVTGHPYIDPYLTNEFDFHKTEFHKHNGKKIIVWCPHHNAIFYGGVKIEDQEAILRNILESNQDAMIYFRPHPNLNAYINNPNTQIENNNSLLSNELIDRLRNYWRPHPRVSFIENGPIYEYFKNADLIIHNCGGYQMEAIYSGSPTINLVNPLILSKHMLQYDKFQLFCENINQATDSINDVLTSSKFTRKLNTGMEGAPFASSLITKNLCDTFNIKNS